MADVSFLVSKHRNLKEEGWGRWLYDAAPYDDGVVQSFSLIADAESPEQLGRIIKCYWPSSVSKILPSNVNHNSGLGLGIHLNHYSGKAVQITVPDAEELALIASLVIGERAKEGQLVRTVASS